MLKNRRNWLFFLPNVDAGHILVSALNNISVVNVICDLCFSDKHKKQTDFLFIHFFGGGF